MLKILFVLDSLRFGGAEILTVRLAERLLRDGHSLFIIALGESGELANRLEQLGVEYTYLRKPNGLRPDITWAIARLVFKHGFDIIITNHFRQLAHTFLPALISKTPLIHLEHDNLIYRSSRKYTFIFNQLSHFISHFVVISPTLKDWFYEHTPSCREKIQVIVNGVDTKIFHPSIEERERTQAQFGWNQDNFICGTCARLEPIKNLKFMLEVFCIFARKNHKSRLLIVGDGSQKASLEDEATRLGIEDKVVFTGFQPEVAHLLKAMDLYLLTSLDEGLPLSILEALACGVPIVASAVGDLPRVLDGYNGKVLESNNIELWAATLDSFAEKITSLPNTTQIFSQSIQKKYSFDVCFTQYLELFKRSKFAVKE